MNIYDNQKDRDIELYAQEIYDEQRVYEQEYLTACDEGIAYLVESKGLLSNAKDMLKILHMYSNVTQLQTMIDDIEANIIELKMKKEEFI